MANILCIGAHPDDVELGCGGAILKHLENDDKVYVMVVTDGEIGSKTQQTKDNRINETVKSLHFAGIPKNQILCLHLPDTEVWRERQKLLDSITQACTDYKIDYVYTHTAQSYHQDHITICEETIRGAKGTLGIFTYETNGGTRTSFAPNIFIDIEDVFERKIHMLHFHKSQSGKKYFDISAIEALSRVRAAQSKMYKYAEAFELVRLSLSIAPAAKAVKALRKPIYTRKTSMHLVEAGGISKRIF